MFSQELFPFLYLVPHDVFKFSISIARRYRLASPWCEVSDLSSLESIILLKCLLANALSDPLRCTKSLFPASSQFYNQETSFTRTYKPYFSMINTGRDSLPVSQPFQLGRALTWMGAMHLQILWIHLSPPLQWLPMFCFSNVKFSLFHPFQWLELRLSCLSDTIQYMTYPQKTFYFLAWKKWEMYLVDALYICSFNNHFNRVLSYSEWSLSVYSDTIGILQKKYDMYTLVLLYL